jgi:Ca2+-binding RTX toxin-like protein
VLDGDGAIDGTGNALANVITGNTATNVLSGLAGNDMMDGGLGNDVLFGGDGNDLLMSNDGADTLVGGGGRDVFELGSGISDPKFPGFIATIADFDGRPGGDAIDLQFVLPAGVTAANAADFLELSTFNGSTFCQ